MSDGFNLIWSMLVWFCTEGTKQSSCGNNYGYCAAAELTAVAINGKMAATAAAATVREEGIHIAFPLLFWVWVVKVLSQFLL